MNLSREEVEKIADAVVESLQSRPAREPLPSPSSSAVLRGQILKTSIKKSSTVCHDTLDDAVQAAYHAQPAWVALSLEKRKATIERARALLREAAHELSEMAVRETGLGRVADKVKKNLLVINKTPGPEYLESTAYTGDDGLTLVEYAPFGVIGAITPVTNPSETIINNGLSMLSAGNAVVFNPHPSARKTSIRAAELINEAIVFSGGPEGCITMVEEPTLETAKELMSHPRIRLLVVTGGPAVVKAAMASGKKVIAGGPGNPPVVVDETAELEQAARGIVNGASFDNNIICTDEKEVFAVESIFDDLISRLQTQGAVLLSSAQVKQVERVILEKSVQDQPQGMNAYKGCGFHSNKNFVGKNAAEIAHAAGIRVSGDPRLLICDVEEEHPFVQLELLMPVLPLVRVKNIETAIETAKRTEHGNGHTAVMYSRNIDHLHQMAKVINTSIFVKNAPNYAGLGFGGEGYTSFTIASPTGEGLTTCRTFSRIRRCTLKDHFRII